LLRGRDEARSQQSQREQCTETLHGFPLEMMTWPTGMGGRGGV
jgi:hypothetical protein